MIRNYFKIAWRNLWKQKLFSFINILGLGLAIPFAMLSLMQVQSAFEFDNFHPDRERIYRVTTDIISKSGDVIKYASSPAGIAEDLEQDSPVVELATATSREYGWELTNRIQSLRVNSLFVEPDFFQIFDFPLEKGSFPEMPNTLVLSKEMAENFFGDADPVGKTLSHHDYGEFTVTGVLKPYKRNTHFRSDVMVSMASLKRDITNTSELSGYTYVKLHEKSEGKDLDAALASVTKAFKNRNIDKEEELLFRSQTLSQISPDFQGLEDNPYTETLVDLSANLLMSLAIILLAGFNYTNLTLAKSLSRAKEVGIRKVAGAVRHQLITQFICEAILVALLSLVIGVFVLKLIQEFIHVNWITWEVDNYWILWLVFIAFAVLTGALSGAIPAKILSGFSPAKVLKGDINPASFGKIGFRKSLVVIQFVVTACFIFLIANMYSQFQYQATDNENFNRKGIYNLTVNKDYDKLKNDLERHKNVDQIGLTSTPFGGTSMKASIKKNAQHENVAASYYAVNSNFISNMELEFVAGENLPETTKESASNFVVVNEQTLYSLGLGTPLEAVGKIITLNDQQEVTIAGVVKNFNYNLYQFPTNALVLQYNPSKFNVLSIKTKGDIQDAAFKADLSTIWKNHFPFEEFSYSNYEKDLYKRYSQGEEMKFMGMVCFTIFIIAIMGLLGIVTYTTEKRYKEVGIRKVLGASVAAIVKELSVGFAKMLLIASAISLPLGYLISYYFIDIFTFNNGVAIGLMAVLFISILLIAFITIAIQAVKAAVTNPVKNLRTE